MGGYSVVDQLIPSAADYDDDERLRWGHCHRSYIAS
jgi:hypothetical protein